MASGHVKRATAIPKGSTFDSCPKLELLCKSRMAKQKPKIVVVYAKCVTSEFDRNN